MTFKLSTIPFLLLFSFTFTTAQLMAHYDTADSKTQEAVEVPAALNFHVKSIKGDDVNLADYKGKVLVVVNVASQCGLTPQYKDLQKLYAENSEKGLMVMGFPCNQFGNQEPGSESDIVEFCSSKYDVTFDMFSKVEVNGDGACDFYKYLTGLELEPKGSGDVGWNFEKFVIDRSGKVIGRFGSRTKPDDEAFVDMVQTALSAK